MTHFRFRAPVYPVSPLQRLHDSGLAPRFGTAKSSMTYTGSVQFHENGLYRNEHESSSPLAP